MYTKIVKMHQVLAEILHHIFAYADYAHFFQIDDFIMISVIHFCILDNP